MSYCRYCSEYIDDYNQTCDNCIGELEECKKVNAKQQELIEQLCANARINFVCKICKKLFADPVDLPCLNTVCKSHLKDLEQNKCRFCNQIHTISNEEATVNETLGQTISMGLHLTSKERDLKQQIETLLNTAKSTTVELSNEEIVMEKMCFDHFATIMNAIDLKKEQLIANIHDTGDILIDQVKTSKFKYEAQLKSNNKKTLTLDEMEKLELTFNEELRNVKIKHENFEALSLNLSNNVNVLQEKKATIAKIKENIKNCSIVINENVLDRNVFGNLKCLN